MSDGPFQNEATNKAWSRFVRDKFPTTEPTHIVDGAAIVDAFRAGWNSQIDYREAIRDLRAESNSGCGFPLLMVVALVGGTIAVAAVMGLYGQLEIAWDRVAIATVVLGLIAWFAKWKLRRETAAYREALADFEERWGPKP